MVAQGWTFCDNPRPFLFSWRAASVTTSCPRSWRPSAPACGSRAEAGRWYAYEFAGSAPVCVRLGQDCGSSVLHYRVECSAVVAEQVRVAAGLIAEYLLCSGWAERAVAADRGPTPWFRGAKFMPGRGR
jgi:hypothetical protein